MIPPGSRDAFAPAEGAGEFPRERREEAVLVVEDERVTRDFFDASLRQAGFDVDAAADGLEALGRLESRSYDAIVLDLHLPRIDGMGVLRFVSERHPELLPRVVLVTGLDLRDITTLYPICSTISKPVTAAKLVEIVRRCLVR